jgi:hypothetical protein
MKYASVDTYGSTDIDFDLWGFYTYLGEEKRIRENIFLILYFSLCVGRGQPQYNSERRI